MYVRSLHPDGQWDDVLSDEEAEILLGNLRIKAPTILRWLVEGAEELERIGSATVH